MAVDTAAALRKLTSGQTLTPEEKAALGIGVASTPTKSQMTQAEIDAATQAVVDAGGSSTDPKNRLKGETASEANARITAAYKAQPKPELTKEGKAAGATIEFVRTGAGGVGEYKEVFPMGTPIPTTRTTEYGNVYDSKGNLISGTGKKITSTTPTTTTPTTTTPTTTTPTTTTPTTTTPTTTTPDTSNTTLTELQKKAAEAEAYSKKVGEAYDLFKAGKPLTAEQKKLLNLPDNYGTTTSTTSTTTTTSITQADVDNAINKALAEQAAKTAAEKREAKAAEDAAKLAVKQKASDRLSAMFAGYGLETLAGFIDRRIKADVSEEMLMLELYEQPEYQLRFPGMKSLRDKKRTITEKEYMDIEQAYTQTARFFDLPKGFYDSPDDFGKLIGNEVSAKEFQDRLQVGQDLARSMSPGLRQQLQEYYNVGEGGITAYVLDADKALPLIQKQAKAAQFVYFAREKNFKLEGMNAAQAEQIAGTEAYSKLSTQQLQTALSQAAQLRQTQSRLTGIEGEVYNENEALKAVIEGSPEALLASQQRAQREGARFGGGAGVTGSSLRSMPTI